jgi:hypothetical protein
MQPSVCCAAHQMLAWDEMQASGGARSAPGSLLHRYKKAEAESARLLATSIGEAATTT